MVSQSWPTLVHTSARAAVQVTQPPPVHTGLSPAQASQPGPQWLSTVHAWHRPSPQKTPSDMQSMVSLHSVQVVAPRGEA